AFAASLMWPGVSKSGSPAPRLMTSMPAAFISATLPVSAFVGEGLMRDMRFARMDMTRAPIPFSRARARYAGFVPVASGKKAKRKSSGLVFSLTGSQAEGSSGAATLGAGERVPIPLSARDAQHRPGPFHDRDVDHAPVERRRSAAGPLGLLERRDDPLGVRDLRRRRGEGGVQGLDLLGV